MDISMELTRKTNYMCPFTASSFDDFYQDEKDSLIFHVRAIWSTDIGLPLNLDNVHQIPFFFNFPKMNQYHFN